MAASLVQVVVDEAVFHGVDEARLFEGAGLDRAVLGDREARLSLDDVRRVVRSAIATSERPELGLCIGSTAPLGALRILGAGFEHGATLRQGAEFFQRFGALIVDGVGLELVDGESESIIRFHAHATVDETSRRFWSEFVITIVARVARGAHGRRAIPRAVRFRHGATAPLARYRDILHCEPQFDRADDEIQFERGLLDRPSMRFDESLCRFVEMRATTLLASLEHSKRVSTSVEEWLTMSETLADVDVSHATSRLGLSARTLRRRLHDEGTSWSDLVDRERMRRANEALTTTDLAIKELSIQLGYSETNAFVRAFSRWSGMTPAAYRKRRGAPPS